MRAFSQGFKQRHGQGRSSRYPSGNLIEWDKRVWRVLKSYHVHVGGRGGAFMQVEMKDIETGTKTNQRFRTEDKVERAFVDPRDMQYLYQDGDSYVFMDKENYEQLSLPADFLEGQAGYLLPNTDVQVNFYNNRPIGLELPPSSSSPSRTPSPASRTPPRPTASSRRRWRPESQCRCRPSSTRARRSRSTPPKASTWSGPRVARYSGTTTLASPSYRRKTRSVSEARSRFLGLAIGDALPQVPAPFFACGPAVRLLELQISERSSSCFCPSGCCTAGPCRSRQLARPRALGRGRRSRSRRPSTGRR